MTALALGLVPLALLGAVLGLDVVSFPQAMISRPLAAATFAGALVGRPGHGLIAGAMLELFALETLPFGASRYPEWGSASVVGVFCKLKKPGSAPAYKLANSGEATHSKNALVSAGCGDFALAPKAISGWSDM